LRSLNIGVILHYRCLLVRPVLEYVTCAWTLGTKSDVDTLECAQRGYGNTSSVTFTCANRMCNSLQKTPNMRDALCVFLTLTLQAPVCLIM